MKVTYDPEVDILRIVLSDAPIAESDDERPGVIFDLSADGTLVGLEILEASQRVDDPRTVSYAITA